MKDRTTIATAHRLSTIKRADRILVIENGRITEMGPHDELIRAGGHYHSLYTKQFHHQAQPELDEMFEQALAL